VIEAAESQAQRPNETESLDDLTTKPAASNPNQDPDNGYFLSKQALLQ
jgi:hypothetical protein